MSEKEKAIARLKENPLDRERWIELGKAMGWGEWICERCGISYQLFKEGNSCSDCRYSERPMKGEYNGSWQESWLYQWHRLIDHLVEGKSIEQFFAELK